MRGREERRGRERRKGEGEKKGGGREGRGRERKEEENRGRERMEVRIELCNNTKSDNMSLTLRSVVRYARHDPRSPTSL